MQIITENAKCCYMTGFVVHRQTGAAVYFTTKAVESIVMLLVSRGVVPELPYAAPLLYAASGLVHIYPIYL